MAIDILDALEHSTRFDEFIIMSADADFTPVLLRLRSHDRRTVIVTVGFTSPAYRAASDFIVNDESFQEALLSGSSQLVSPSASFVMPRRYTTVPTQVLEAMASRLSDIVGNDGLILAPDLPAVFRGFREFTPDSNWLGFGSLRALTLRLIDLADGLELAEGEPWRVAPRTGVTQAAVQSNATEEVPVELAIVESIENQLKASARAIPFAAAAQGVRQSLGSRISENWNGYGTFGRLIRSFRSAAFTVAEVGGVGYIYDEDRHETPAVTDPFVGLPEETVEILNRLCRITGTPRLSSAGYGLLFNVIADEVNGNGYHLIRTSKAARDICIEKSAELPVDQRPQIPRDNVNFVLAGIRHGGYVLDSGMAVMPRDIADAFKDNVLSLCDSAFLNLSDQQRGAVEQWLLACV